MSFGPAAQKTRQRITSGLAFVYLWRMLPLAAFAGLRVVRLDHQACGVRLPGGWRTQNPFRSTYFAAQAMAAEMSTGAPALVLREDAAHPVSMLVLAVHASYSKRLTGPGTFTCEDVPAIRSAIDRAAASGEAQVVSARSTGRNAAGETVADFTVDWSFKRRDPK